MSTIIINPGDTEGTKWYKLGEIAKTVGTGGYTPPVYPIVYTASLLFNMSTSVFSSSRAQKWLYHTAENDVTLTLATPSAVKIGQEILIYQAGSGTLTLNPGACTLIGQASIATKGELLVIKKIGATTFCSYVTARAVSVSVDVDGSNPQLGVTRDNSKLVYYAAGTIYPFAIWRASYYTVATNISVASPIYLTWKACPATGGATKLSIDGTVYDQRTAGEHYLTAGTHTIGPVASTWDAPYISGLRTP